MSAHLCLADRTQVTISDCLKDVDITFQGNGIKTNVWIHDDSPMEDLSLGKDVLYELGCSLCNPSGKSIWTTPAALAADPGSLGRDKSILQA